MDLKRQAAERALEYVRDGMTLGLGTGSTMAHFIEMLGMRVRQGRFKDLRAVPTSEQTARQARESGITLVSLMEAGDGHVPVLDLAVDGADEVDADLNLIKGLGRALLREKIVETHAREFLVVVDDSKLVSRLGTRGPLPVEIVPFNADVQVAWLALLGCRSELWLEEDGLPVVTDNRQLSCPLLVSQGHLGLPRACH